MRKSMWVMVCPTRREISNKACFPVYFPPVRLFVFWEIFFSPALIGGKTLGPAPLHTACPFRCQYLHSVAEQMPLRRSVESKLPWRHNHRKLSCQPIATATHKLNLSSRFNATPRVRHITSTHAQLV